MALTSSPVVYPPSSSPTVISHKRKLFQTFRPKEVSPKRPRILGGFVLDEDSGDEDTATQRVSNNGGSENQLKRKDDVTNTINPSSEDPIVLIHDEQSTTVASTSNAPLPTASLFSSRLTAKSIQVQTSYGEKLRVSRRTQIMQQSYEQTIAQRSTIAPGRAQKAYYGIDIHRLIDEAKTQKELNDAAAEYKKQNEPAQSVEQHLPPLQKAEPVSKSAPDQMWTEKYRAKKFTDLVGDERTHRSVLRWLKSWDPVVFPGNSKVKTKRIYEDQEQQHRKIMLLTGPPGLGKTTLAHVCAKQAGYEVLEINASDDRSRDIVKGRIKDALGTETVRGIQEKGKARRAGRPVCVVVDEVDGVVTGSGGSGGEGGFMKALIDLVQLDQRNINSQPTTNKGKKKGDRFKLMRPLILICNDVYAPSLRPLRQSTLAEIVHVRKPPIEKVIGRMRTIFEKEHIISDNDAVRRLCESSWGLGTRKQNSLGGRGAGDGDIRGVLVQGEWMAHKLRASHEQDLRMTRKWVEEHISSSTASHDGLGRGGVKEVVERIFIEGAGLPNLSTTLSKDDARLVAESKTNPVGVADSRKRAAISALRGMIDTTGDHDRLMTECFTTYPTLVYQDDTLLTKPNASYEWLHFHDMLSSRVYSGQEWELNPYLSTSACGFHDLFATIDKGTKIWEGEKAQNDGLEAEKHPFSGFKADFTAYEAEKANRTVLTEMQAGFNAPLLRLFSSIDTISTDLIPNVSRILAPDVKPVVVGGSGSNTSVASVRKDSEKKCVQNAVRVMYNLGIAFEKVKIENEGYGAHTNGGFALRMEPPIDNLASFHISKPPAPSTTTTQSSTTQSKHILPTAPVRYAIRQVLSQELYKEKALQASLSRQARVSTPTHHSSPPLPSTDKENNPPSEPIKSITHPGSAPTQVKKDFFGRPIRPSSRGAGSPETSHPGTTPASTKKSHEESSASGKSASQRTWVSFHEGYSNAVRKYIGLKELMDGF